MANLSDATRKDQVLRYLSDHDGWVDGPELANERVGGSEGLKRVRELRAEGHRIVTRPHPDRQRDIFQYRLIKPEGLAPVIQERLDSMLAAPAHGTGREAPLPPSAPEPPAPSVTPGLAGREFPLRRNEAGEIELTHEVCVECGGWYDDDLEHRTTDPKHLRWLELQERQRFSQTTIGVPEQPRPFKFTEMPKKIDMGQMMICPRCNGTRRKRREWYSRKSGETIINEAEDFTRDPFKPTIKGEPNMCPRCGGFGVVPVFVVEEDVASVPEDQVPQLQLDDPPPERPTDGVD